jgi:hypothetical protein
MDFYRRPWGEVKMDKIPFPFSPNPCILIAVNCKAETSLHNSKNEYPDFVANLTYNEKQIPEADYV